MFYISQVVSESYNLRGVRHFSPLGSGICDYAILGKALILALNIELFNNNFGWNF